ncbi:MAG: aspartate/glutamate racemase family protein [Burkholderiales bacterium]|nr:aspartate/glutamate racemase family protein [Burkholderiales bacterium]
MHASQDSAPARIAVLGSGTRTPVLPPHLAELGDAHAVPVLCTTRLAAFAGNPYDRLVVDLAYVDMAERAAADGCAAIFINTYADYGIAAMRAALSVPVIGAGEAAMTLAAAGGRRFSIVTIWPPSMGFLYDERTRAVPAGAACVRVRHVSAEEELQRLGSADDVQQRMARREDAIVAAIVAECDRAVREDGAQAIVLGCTCMAPVGPAVAARVAVPVIEGSRAGYRAAVAALGEAPARRGPRTGRAGLIPAIVDAYVGAGTGTAPPATGEAAPADCPVCVS